MLPDVCRGGPPDPALGNGRASSLPRIALRWFGRGAKSYRGSSVGISNPTSCIDVKCDVFVVEPGYQLFLCSDRRSQLITNARSMDGSDAQ